VREWLIELPWSTPPVKPNGGYSNRYAHATKVRNARQVMGLLGRAAGLPVMARCEVLLTWHVGDKVARDADNLVWTLKPLCDALSSGKKPTDHPIVADDTPEFMVKPMPVVEFVRGQRKRLSIRVRELETLESLPNSAEQ
jgi:crossover junction endodeoxyribonuclease RusA